MDTIKPELTASPQEPQRAAWRESLWFVLLLLIFVTGPFGLPLVWKNSRFSQTTKRAITLFMVVYALWTIDLIIRVGRWAFERVSPLLS
jgi:hypothetical protein